MKKLIILLCLGLFSQAKAQNMQYKTLYDNPDKKPWMSINLNLFQLDMGVSNLDGTSFNIGTFGFIEPIDRVGIDYNFNKSWLTLGKISNTEYPSNLDLNIGGYFKILTNKKSGKKTKVVLKTEYSGTTYSTNYKGEGVNTRTETVTYVMVPGSRYSEMSVRAGLYYKRGPYNFDAIEPDGYDGDLAELGLTSVGSYGGIQFTWVKNLFIDADGYGVQYNSIGDDIYIDALLISNSFRDVNMDNADVNAVVEAAQNASPIGFRIGWRRYQIEKKKRTGKNFGLCALFEAGMKPYQGFFINGGIGLTIIKAHRPGTGE